MDTQEVTEVLWAYFCTVGYGGSIRPIFGTSTTHIPTHEVSEVLRVYLCSFQYAGVKTNIWH